MTRSVSVITLIVTASASTSAVADLYTDAAGDIFDAGLGNLDILGAEVTNDDTNLYVTVQVAADVTAVNWGKYLLFLDTGDGGAVSGSAGNDPYNNPWNRRVTATEGIDAFLGSWIDGGGGSLAYNWNGGGWNDEGNLGVEIAAGGDLGAVGWTISLDLLGLAVGDTFAFDIATTGGNDNDPGIDFLSTDVVQAGWGENSSSPMAASYTVVPAPGVLGLLGLAGLAARRRRH
jgi:hypothetical protein